MFQAQPPPRLFWEAKALLVSLQDTPIPSQDRKDELTFEDKRIPTLLNQ